MAQVCFKEGKIEALTLVKIMYAEGKSKREKPKKRWDKQ